MNDSAAALAGRIVIIVARVAERRTVCACIVVSPDSVAAVFANNGFAVVAVIAEYAAVECLVVIGFDCRSAAIANGAVGFVVVHSVSSSIFFCQKHGGMCLNVNDEYFCRDGFVSLELKRAFVDGFLLTVRDVLGMVLCREFENLKIILFGFHAVDAVPENDLR